MKQVHYRAAGGVVLDEAGRVLLIERTVTREGQPFHEVRLPKGHVEAGETDEQAAVREVCEETGYCALAIVADLGESRVSYELERKGKRRAVTRDSHYYLMRLTDDHNRGQDMDEHKEESLFVPIWVAGLAEAEAVLTFDEEKEFIRRAMALSR